MNPREFASITVYENWADCARNLQNRRIFAVSTKGMQRYDMATYVSGDVFLFGSESGGLGVEMLENFPEDHRIRVPMAPGNRSLNLSNAVAIIVYEAWRQMEFTGAK